MSYDQSLTCPRCSHSGGVDMGESKTLCGGCGNIYASGTAPAPHAHGAPQPASAPSAPASSAPAAAPVAPSDAPAAKTAEGGAWIEDVAGGGDGTVEAEPEEVPDVAEELDEVDSIIASEEPAD